MDSMAQQEKRAGSTRSAWEEATSISWPLGEGLVREETEGQKAEEL